jgi:hypothetical protein
MDPLMMLVDSYHYQILMIHKIGEVYSLWFFEELLELIGIFCGVHLDLSNGNSTTVCGVFLYRGSCLS